MNDGTIVANVADVPDDDTYLFRVRETNGERGATVEAAGTDAEASGAVATDADTSGAVATDAEASGAVATDAEPSGAVATDAEPSGAVATDADATGAVATDAGGSTREPDATVDEAILTKSEGGVVAYLNRCMHFRHVRLDKGDGASMRNGEIVCTNHGAMFDEATGACTYGPCEGAVLETIEIDVVDDDVYLVDDDYAYEGQGPIATDPGDLSSDSNVEW